MGQLPLILYYIGDPKKEKLFREFCKRQDCRVRALGGADMKKEVGCLSGILPTAAGRTHREVPEGFPMPEVLIFSGFSMNRLEMFLDEYKMAGIPPIGLKAVLTEHNLGWTVYELVTELMRERMAMMTGQTGKPSGTGKE